MEIFHAIIKLLGGLAMFLYGIEVIRILRLIINTIGNIYQTLRILL